MNLLLLTLSSPRSELSFSHSLAKLGSLIESSSSTGGQPPLSSSSGSDALKEESEEDIEAAELMQTKCSLTIDQRSITLQPLEKRSITLTIKAGIPESYRTLLEVIVANSEEKQYIHV